MANPLTELRKIITQNLLGYLPLIAKLGGGQIAVQRMQQWDNEADARGDMAANPDLKLRLQLDPDQSVTDFAWSSSDAKFVRTYLVMLGTGSVKLEDLEEIEWLATKALAYLYRGVDVQEGPLAAMPPLTLETIRVGQIDPEREPTTDENFGEWTALMQVTIEATAPVAQLATA